jgi:hypothetical protein
MKNSERLIWIGVVVVALFAGYWTRPALERAGSSVPVKTKVRSIEARCGVAAGGALSSKELAITCGLDDAGVEAVIADAIGELDLATLVKQIGQGTGDLPAAVDDMALRLGITREAVVDLLTELGARESGEDITAASLARTITRGEPVLVVNVISTIAGARDEDASTKITSDGPTPQNEKARGRSGANWDDTGVLDASRTVIEESEGLRAECGVVAGGDAELGIARITCGPNKEEVDVIIRRLMEESQIDQVIADLRRGTLAHTQLLDSIGKELNLSRSTALTLLKHVADAGAAPGQAASQFGALTKQHLEVTYRLGQLPVDDPAARKLRDLAAAAVSTGDFATAETLWQQWSDLQKATVELSAAQQEVVALRSELDTLTRTPPADATGEAGETEGPKKVEEMPKERPDSEEPSTKDIGGPFVSQDRVVLKFPAQVDAGAQFKIEWRGPAAPEDLIFVAPIDQAENRYPGSDRNRHDASERSPAFLTAPADAGKYEVRYLSYANAKPLAREPLEVVAPKVELRAPESTPAGSPMEIEWSGPDSPGDLLFIAEPTMEKSQYFLADRQRHATSTGSPATLVAPAKEGSYEIRYYSYNNGAPLVRQSLAVTAPEVRFEAPETVSPGAHLKFSWVGPNAPGDMIFIAKRDLDKSKYVVTGRHRHLTSDGPVAELVAPADSGEHELRYFSYANGTVLAATPLTVE